MPLEFNIRHVEARDLILTGELPVADLDLATDDEVVHARTPLRYRLGVQKLEENLLARGTLELDLECECVRCLAAFPHRLRIPDWTCHLPLEGEDAVPVVNDLVDLTPFLRDDILLELPQHPLCRPECGGLSKAQIRAAEETRGPSPTGEVSSVWSELDRLKL